MHGPDLATRLQNLTTQQGFLWIPQDSDLVKMNSASFSVSSGPPGGRGRDKP